MDKFDKIPIWVVIMFAFAAMGVCLCLEIEPLVSCVTIMLAIGLFPKIPVWVVVVLSSAAAAFCAFCDFRIFRALAVAAVFVFLSCKLVNWVLKLTRILGAKLLNKETKETEQYEGDDPDGLGRPYVWSGKPAEFEKDK